mgnify:CR=1 FL=1
MSTPEVVKLGEEGVYILTAAGEEIVISYNLITLVTHCPTRWQVFLADDISHLEFPVDKATPAVHEAISQLMKSLCGIK